MSSRIPQSFIRDLIDRTDIVEIVQARVQLKKKGQNHHGRCPFHEEKTPSFTVSENKQFYYCFGCSAHGNALDFLMNYDRMEFIDAIKYLAAHHGVDLPQVESYTADRSYDALFPIMQKATKFFRQQLAKHPHAIDYLKSRGLTGEIAKCFSIGFAPPGWNNLTNAIGTDPKSHTYLTTTGMAIDRDRSNPYDRFRDRIMFPIHDSRGRVIAFGGRALNNEDQPKYLNSPETPIFHKNRELYGLYQARQANRKLERLLIVEGYMDVVSLNQHGITYAVATLGTAINAKHLQKCLRFTNEVVFCFDGDNAGRGAAWKALTIAMPLLRDGIHLRFLFLPDKEDPDTLIREIGKEAFEAKIVSAETLRDVFFNHLAEEYKTDTLDNRAAFAKAAKEYLNEMPQGIYQELLLGELANILDIEKHELDLIAVSRKPRKHVAAPIISETKTKSPMIEHCLTLLLQSPSLATHVDDISFLQVNCDNPQQVMLLQLLQIFKAHPELPVGQLLSHWEDVHQQSMIARLASKEMPFPKDGFENEFLDTIKTLKQQARQSQITALVTKAKNNQLSEDEKTKLNALLSTSGS